MAGEEQYSKFLAAFTDLCLAAVFPAKTLDVYMAIRRFVRRDKSKIRPTDRVFSIIHQEDLAISVGTNRRRVSEIIALLERMGWLERVGGLGGTQQVYDIGDRKTVKQAGVVTYEETYWADSIVTNMRRLVIQRGGNGAKLPVWKTRLTVVRQLVADSSPERASRGEPNGYTVDPPCSQTATGDVAKRLQGVLPFGYIHNREENKQALNREESLRRSDFVTPAEAPDERSALVDSFNETSEPIALPSQAGDRPTDQLRPEIRFRSISTALEISDEETSSDPYQKPVALSVVAPPEEEIDVDFAKIQRAKAAADAAALKNTAQREANEAKKVKRAADSQREENLKGAPKKHSRVSPLHKVWMEEFKKKYPTLPEDQISKWYVEGKGQKEVGQAYTLISKFSLEAAIHYVRYCFANWETLRARFKNSPSIPTIGWLLSISATLLPEEAALKGQKLAEAQTALSAPPGEISALGRAEAAWRASMATHQPTIPVARGDWTSDSGAGAHAAKLLAQFQEDHVVRYLTWLPDAWLGLQTKFKLDGALTIGLAASRWADTWMPMALGAAGAGTSDFDKAKAAIVQWAKDHPEDMFTPPHLEEALMRASGKHGKL